MSTVTTNIESVLQEERIFPPPPEFAAQAHIKSEAELEKLRDEANTDLEAFWSSIWSFCEVRASSPYERVLAALAAGVEHQRVPLEKFVTSLTSDDRWEALAARRLLEQMVAQRGTPKAVEKMYVSSVDPEEQELQFAGYEAAFREAKELIGEKKTWRRAGLTFPEDAPS